MSEYKIGFKKSVVRMQGVRGVFSKTVYKPTVNGRIVGTLASDYEGGAKKLAEQYIARFYG